MRGVESSVYHRESLPASSPAENIEGISRWEIYLAVSVFGKNTRMGSIKNSSSYQAAGASSRNISPGSWGWAWPHGLLIFPD